MYYDISVTISLELESESDFGPKVRVGAQVFLGPELECGVQNFLTPESESHKNKDCKSWFRINITQATLAYHWKVSNMSKLNHCEQCHLVYFGPFGLNGYSQYCRTLNFGVWVNVIILDPVILAFLLPTTLKRYFIKIFAAHYFRELARLAKFAK